MTRIELWAGRMTLEEFEKAEAEVTRCGCVIVAGEIGLLHANLVVEGGLSAIACVQAAATLKRLQGFSIHERRRSLA